MTAPQLERARLAELNAYERIENAHEQLASLISQAEVAGDWRLYFWQRDMVRAVDLAEVNDALQRWAVAVNRSDVLLRHADGVAAPQLPAKLAPDVGALLAGRHWPPIATNADALPDSASELARATIDIALDGQRARGALISRRTQGDRAWLALANDYGDEASLAGRLTVCGFADQLLSYGGAGFDRDQLAAKLDALQAQWSLGLSGVAIEAPRRNVDAALDLLLAVWASPTLPEAEFNRLKSAAIARLEAALKDPAQVAVNLAALRFDNYPPGHPLQPRSLEQLLAEARAATFKDTAACAADFAGLAQVRLALVGAFSPADAQAIWQRVDRLPRAKVAYQRIRELPAPKSVDTAAILVAMPEKPNASVAGSTLLAITDDDDDFPALRIAVKVLGGDADSRIWTRLREREGLAYGAGVSLAGNSFEPRSRFALQASAASDKADAALAGLQDELARALKDGFTPAEVERAKRAWLQERKTMLRDERAYAASLAQGLYSGRDYAWLARYDEKIAELDAAQVTRALRKYLADAPLVWSVGRGD